ncbi:uncharacterized protein LOC112575176 [Pomacea canaliculata]|uniref:uncharacterized protein LOC112575176 n=1 Tax=Pomacea canaliculata TaxID=400727 RepID=UPI000D7316F9|nr:uncharacterized protein LOC112575176 [Pomacea canaliculata]
MDLGFLFLLLLQAMICQCFYVSTVSAQEDKITCTIPPVAPSRDTVLTCHFPEDLSVTKKDFTIYRYVEHSNPVFIEESSNGYSLHELLVLHPRCCSQEPVVDCWWLNGAIDCFAKAGFEYNKVVSRTLNVTISHVTQATGKYACQVAGYVSRLLETCELNFKYDDKVGCTIASVKPFHDTTLKCYFPEDLSVTKKDFTVYHYPEHGTPESVVDCWWINGAIDCYTKSGFRYDRVVGRTLNVTVSHVTKAAGQYACQVAGYASNLLETCQLTFKHGENNTCSISKKESHSQGILTCLFNEDIQRTQRNFTVYKHHGHEKRSVLHCWWSDGRVSCHVTQNYYFDKEVSSYLQVRIPSTSNEGEVIYSCWHDGSQADRVETCSFNTDCTRTEAPKTVIPSVIGISLGGLAVVILPVIVIVVFKKLRRCVPSTEKNAEVPVSPVYDQVPETEIFVIENYFESHDLYPDIRELLQEPRVFLVGPPSTDRTDILCHVGRKWIAEGHVVYLINLRSSGHPATTRLQQLLQQRDGNNSRTSLAHATVIPLLCDIKDDKKINNNINKLVQCSKEKILCALVDDLAPESREQEEKVQIFLTKLHERLPNLHLWAASDRPHISPPGWRGKPLPKFLSCPLPVIKKAEQTKRSRSAKCFRCQLFRCLTRKNVCHPLEDTQGRS